MPDAFSAHADDQPESQRLLAEQEDSMEMGTVGPLSENGDKSLVRVTTAYTDDTAAAESSRDAPTREGDELDTAEINPAQEVEYKVYKIRFLGLAQLILLNIVVSWDVC